MIARPRDGARREVATIAEVPPPAPWSSPDLQLAARAAPAVPSGWEEPSALLLANQFAMMQQQMFDQFGQMFRTMVEMMGENQREQMALVREEVERLRQLAGELAELRSTAPKALAARPPAVEDRARAPPPARAPRSAPRLPADAGGRAPGDEALDWVCRRIAEIEGEQKTGWQRLAGLMKGAKSGRNSAP